MSRTVYYLQKGPGCFRQLPRRQEKQRNLAKIATTILHHLKCGTEATIEGYRKWDIEAILNPRAENCSYNLLPESIGVLQRNNAEYREWYLTQVTPLFKNFSVRRLISMILNAEIHGRQVTIRQVMYDVEARKSMVHTFSDAESLVGPYHIELMLVLTFDDAGEKIVKMEEFFDSAYITQFLAKVESAMSVQGGETQA
jgi:hypothetical protein